MGRFDQMAKSRGIFRRRVSRRALIKASAGGIAGAMTGVHSLSTVFASDPAQQGVQRLDIALPDGVHALAVGVPSILVITGNSGSNPFTGYVEEILRAEGVRDVEVRPLGALTAGVLGGRR